MPVPFYDANDGFPAYLLLNDGQGNFSDVTDLAGLTKHRFRRTFSSTFTDLDAAKSVQPDPRRISARSVEGYHLQQPVSSAGEVPSHDDALFRST